MFRVACFVLLAVSHSLFAQSSENLRWADLVESKLYTLDREISLSHNKSDFTLNRGAELRLLDFRPLPMINVFLAELKIINCSRPEFSSEMALVEIAQPTGRPVAVGVDIAKKCVFEVFLEKKDYNATSFFK